jgi:uncharacterized cupredoxin-like copper-binding protein
MGINTACSVSARFAAILLVLAAGAGIASGCGGSASGKEDGAQAARAVQVSENEWSVQSSAADAASGKVSISVTNDGKSPHELIVIRTDKPAADLGGGKQAPESGSIGEVEGVRPGATSRKSFRLKPGHYALICNIPGHYKAGMHADLEVG